MKHDNVVFIQSMLICGLVASFLMATYKPSWELTAVFLVVAALFFLNLASDRLMLDQEELNSVRNHIQQVQERLDLEISILKKDRTEDHKAAEEMRKFLSTQRLAESVGKQRMR